MALVQAEVVAARADAKAEKQRAAREKAWAKREWVADSILRSAEVELTSAFAKKGWTLEKAGMDKTACPNDLLVFRTQGDMRVIVRVITAAW
jgi:hypothetical protein